MELVVVNGSSNIAKSVIRGITRSGQYNRVRLLDYRPFKQTNYAFQREMQQQGITVDKRMTTDAQALEINMEGAQKLVYFTHDYTNMTACKNNFLIAAAKIAKRQGVSQMVAVCPVEHDLVHNENPGSSWIDQRKEAEQTALDAHPGLSLLSTDLVFGADPAHITHYMAQCAMVGQIKASLLSEKARFSPVHQSDVARAVAASMDTGLKGHFAVRGDQNVSMRQLMDLVESSCNVVPGTTKGKSDFYFPALRFLEEILVGKAIDTNMADLISYFEESQESPVEGQDIWEASGVTAEENLQNWFASRRVQEDDPNLLFPTFGAYKTYAD